MVLLGLLLQNGNPVLEIRKADICDHAPLEPADEASLEAYNLRRRPVACENDLPAGLVESVERVEELFLCGLFAFQKVNVVDQKQIGLAVALPECLPGSVSHRGDQLVHELLGSNVGDPGARISLERFVRNCLHKMGFANARRAVDEQRVVGPARRLGNCVSRGSRQLVGLSDYEEVERVPVAERG